MSRQANDWLRIIVMHNFFNLRVLFLGVLEKCLVSPSKQMPAGRQVTIRKIQQARCKMKESLAFFFVMIAFFNDRRTASSFTIISINAGRTKLNLDHQEYCNSRHHHHRNIILYQNMSRISIEVVNPEEGQTEYDRTETGWTPRRLLPRV